MGNTITNLSEDKFLVNYHINFENPLHAYSIQAKEYSTNKGFEGFVYLQRDRCVKWTSWCVTLACTTSALIYRSTVLVLIMNNTRLRCKSPGDTDTKYVFRHQLVRSRNFTYSKIAVSAKLSCWGTKMNIAYSARIILAFENYQKY